MALNIKEILADGLLDLSREKPLKAITIKEILEHTGISRQSFYNHFFDKNDLIQYIYLHKIISDFDYDEIPIDMDFREGLAASFYKMKKYHSFMKQALLMEDQNCLKDYLFEHCRQFDLSWNQKRYGNEPMPDALHFATEYHSLASSSMTVSWILSDMPTPVEEMADLITNLRSVGMEKLFENGEVKGNPYKKN